MSEPISLDFGFCRALVSGDIPGLGVALIPEILALEDAERMAPAEVLLDLGDLLQWCDLVGYALALEGEVLRRAEGAPGYVWAVIRAEEDLDCVADMVLDGVTEDDVRRWEGQQHGRDHVAELLEQGTLERLLLEGVTLS